MALFTRTLLQVNAPPSLNRRVLTPRQTSRAIMRPAFAAAPPRPSPLLRLHQRFISDDTRKTIDGVLATAPVVLFMKGTPETPQCGFSRASVQILGLQGVDPDKFTAYNVLQDEEVRQGE